MSGVSGLLLFDKPAGWTSHDAAQFLRARLPQRPKIGHTGTLDPLATGLLVLLVGPATRRQAEFQKERKAYAGRFRLGVETDTGDMEGRIVRERPVPPLTLEALQERARAFVGRRTVPAPAYSAVKHKGKPLYYYARRGIAVPPKDREMEVLRWDIGAYDAPEASFEMEVASGTYVRSLAELLGADLGCGAAVSALRRTRVGPFRIDDALSESRVREMTGTQLAGSLLPVAEG